MPDSNRYPTFTNPLDPEHAVQSLEFLLFLPLVFSLYWLLNRRINLRWQNLFLLLVSYVFCGWWDARFLVLIAFSTLVDYAVGLRIEASGTNRKRAKGLLLLSLITNLGLLAYFKYANFFIDSWVHVWANIGVEMNVSTLQIILPVGISFYTFQTLSYSIDIYRGKLKPTRDPIAFATFVAFFPQLVADPIERARDLLPQIAQKRRFNADFAASGLRFGLESPAPHFPHPPAGLWQVRPELPICLPARVPDT